MVAMSVAVAKPLENTPLSQVLTATAPDADAMRAAIENLVTGAIRVEGRPGAH